MRVAVLADIHGNLPAVEAVLEDIERQAPDYICAAGDLALRGAFPAETVDLLFDKCDSLLIGNTDCYIAGVYLSGSYREREHWKTELLAWTRDQLGPERIAKLGAMPFSVRYNPRPGPQNDLFVCHANPRNLEESIEPTLDEHTLRRMLSHLDAGAVAFGHLHFPYRRRLGRMVIADVASAGIPRDGDMRAAWGLFTYTPKGWRVQIRRVRYAIRKATQAFHDRKVPGAAMLAHKILEARYRHHGALAEAARKHSGLPPQGNHGPQQGNGQPRPPNQQAVGQPEVAAKIEREGPPPGQSTQDDEADDELMQASELKTQVPDLPHESTSGDAPDSPDTFESDLAGK